MAGRNILQIDTSGFDEYIYKLKALGENAKEAVEDALIQAAETVGDDTFDAVQAAYLPAKGKYSKGATAESIVRNPSAKWIGTVCEVGVGFDYAKQGAGGFLISGTPRMRPDYKLEDIYARKRYMRNLQEDIVDVLEDYIVDSMR